MFVSRKKYDQLKAEYDQLNNEHTELKIKYGEERSNNRTMAYKVMRVIDACKKHDKRQIGNINLCNTVKRWITYEQ